MIVKLPTDHLAQLCPVALGQPLGALLVERGRAERNEHRGDDEDDSGENRAQSLQK